MKTKTERKTWIITGVTLLMAVLLFVNVWILSLAYAPLTNAEDDLPAPKYEELDYEPVRSGDVDDVFGGDPSAYAPKNGKVETAHEFCYVMFMGPSGKFTLQKNFKITATNWFDHTSTLAASTTLYGNEKVVWNAAVKGVDASGNKQSTAIDTVGGLLSTNNGTIQDLYFYFTGSFYTKIGENHDALSCGGMIGKNSGTVNHCRIEVTGTIATEALKAETTSSVGGMVGINYGDIKNSAIISSADIMVYSSANPSKDYKKCYLYGGGVIGWANAKGITNCSVLSKAKVMVCDYTRFFGDLGRLVSNFIKSFLPGQSMGEDDYPFNPVRYVHPAGGIIGCADNASYVKNSTLEAWGNANSIGYEGTSNEGTMAGGFIGLLGSEFGGEISNNYFKLGCYVGASYIHILELDAAQIGQTLMEEFVTKREVNIYGGAWIGKALSDKAYKFKSNVLYIEGDNSIIEGGLNGNDRCKEHSGLISGSEIRNATENTNNWLVRKLSQCDTGRITNNGAVNAGFNAVNVFGDGLVVATPSSTGAVTMKAAPGKSPFYGWSTEPYKDDPSFNRQKIRQFSGNIQNTVIYLFFIDQEIKSSGELTQFALDVNLIKAYVWAHLSETSNDDGKVHYPNMKITLSWLTTELKEDILVEKGTPVIEEFYGKFLGNGHKISFASGSAISHDFKKDSDDEDKTYYNEYTTGLFGVVKSGAVIDNLHIVYGGAIKEEGGLEFGVTDAAREQVQKLKETPQEDTDTVEYRTYTPNSFTMPSSLDVDTSYVYLLKSANDNDTYDSSREWNPGYVEVFACAYDVIVETHYVGVLAAKNYGSISGVTMDMTTTGSISVQAKNVVCGGLVGYNNGSLSEANVTVKGKIIATSSASATVGGMIGLNEKNASVTEFDKLNVWVSGEITLKRAEKYHRVVKHFYKTAKTFGTKDDCTNAGYTVIAYDFKDDEKYVFGVKDSQAIVSDTIHGNDDAVLEQKLGALIGESKGSGTKFQDCVASAGDKGTFNTDVIQCSEDTAQIGGVIGKASNVPEFHNVWAVMSSLAVSRKPVSTFNGETGINAVYVDGGIAVGTIDDEADPIKFAIEAIEGKTFAGWYDGVTVSDGVLNTDNKQMIFSGFETEEVLFGEGDDAIMQLVEYFRPSNQAASNRIYYVRLINLQISQPSDLVALSETTNAGRAYEDITFTLAETFPIPSSFKPIGTDEHPFLGVFDGNGLKLTFSGVADNTTDIGLFGCLGKEGSTAGTVKNVSVHVTGNLGTNSTKCIGIIAAKNYGTIGQDSSNGKILVSIESTLTGVIAGGIVGENHGVVKNCEVTFLSTTKNKGYISANAAVETAYAGGAIGRNLDASASVKNVIVTFEDAEGVAQIGATGVAYALGGLVGENGAGATLASSVAEMCHKDILDVMGTSGQRYGGYLVGHNLSQNVSALWIVYKDPALGDPVKVDDGTGSVNNGLVPLNGTKNNEGNVLIMYGEGVIEVAISGVTDQITFYSEKMDDGADFYSYLADFELGTYVSIEDGNTGRAFAPPASMTGKVYYAVFANSMISSESDYNALAARINNDDFRAYVNYSIGKSFEIKQSDSVAIGALARTPFRGSMNGNGYTVTLRGNAEEEYAIHAFIGYVGEHSTISYLTVVSQSGTKMEGTGSSPLGILCNVNNGTIIGVQVIARGLVHNASGAIGAVAGQNNGTVTSATVYLEYLDYLGIKTYGAFIGLTVGGAVGINNGVIGDQGVNTVEVHVDSDDKYGVLYGSEYTGGIVGVNQTEGTILSATSMISGALIGKNVGGIVGSNQGSVSEAFANVLSGAIYFASESFGGVAGVNTGFIGEDKNGFSSDIRVYIAATPRYNEGVSYSFTTPKADAPYLTVAVASPSTKRIGGVAGINKGEMRSLSVEIVRPLYASYAVGGLAGLNEGGIISYAELTTSASGALVAQYVGGIAAENKNDKNAITYVKATLRGDLGSAEAGANGIVRTSGVGAFFASSTDLSGHEPSSEVMTGGTEYVVVTLYGALYGDAKALAIARGNIDTVNSWLQATNASPLPLALQEGTARLNSLRVLNDTLLDVLITVDRIKFTSTIKSSVLDTVAEWYDNISGWYASDTRRSGFLEGDVIIDNAASYVTPKNAIPQGVTYYVCYDSLEIYSSQELFDLSIKINNHDYYRDVRFALTAGIYVERGESLTPIGTADHPFNAIFDGNNNSIVFSSGAIISGTEYAGLFGYTSANSIIRDFILDIRSGAKVGGVNSKTIGALAGESHGTIHGVYVNLATDIVANSAATIGIFVGRYSCSEDATNCWVASANSIYKAVGNLNEDKNDLCYGINSLDILGSGALNVDHVDETSNVIYTVPSSVDVDLFAGFYSNISQNIIITDEEYGIFTQPTGDSKVISVIPSKSVKNAVVTISFFKTNIRNAKDFVNFAKNVNLYGDRGAEFSLLIDEPIEIDFNDCPSIGTKERPFTGTFQGNGKTIRITGSLIKRDYAGVFGYIGEGGSVNDLKIEVTGENVVFGDRSTLYAGVAAAYLRGTLYNVAVTVRADTVVHTTQGTAASGGLVGRAEAGYTIRNAWLVLAEGSDITNAVGLDAFYLENCATRGIGRIMQQVGEGDLRTTIRAGSSINFEAFEGSFYGFIDNDDDSDEVDTIQDAGNKQSWTVTTGHANVGVHMLAIFIQSDIKTYDDLKRLSADVRMGRNFRGITYNLTSDIVLENDFIPIGGEFASASSVSNSYDLSTFIGGFNGMGHKITLPAVMNNAAADGLRYAGLFGRVGKEARIYDLLIVAPENTAIGYDTGDNTTRTQYAGALTGYYDAVSGGEDAKKGFFRDIFIILERGTTLYGSMSVGRTFGYMPLEAGTVTENCWVVSYNSKVNYDMNAAEMTYWNASEKNVGTNQGGVHNIMVIAAGRVTVGRANGKFYFIIDGDSNWYTLNSISEKIYFTNDVKEEIAEYHTFTPNAQGDHRYGYNVSFLKEEITSLAELNNYAANINNGYDFYKLTFKLTADITIDRVENAEDFISIGTAENGLNGTFDGCGHTITLASRAKINGAGVFGYVSEDGFLKNIRIVLQGAIESNGYVGAIGYNYGTMENILVVSDGATMSSPVGCGFVIGHDDTNLLTNVWGLVDASEYLPEVGYSLANKPSVNTMKVIGIGKLTAEFNDAAHGDYKVKFYERPVNEAYVGISGWYKSYEEHQQISGAMLTGGELTVDHMIAPLDSVAAHYEVAVIQTKIKNQDELIALAKDVNVGGYSFKNVEFTLENDFEVDNTTYISIGNEEHAFKGVFNGNHKTITMKSVIKTGIFGNNAGEIKDLFVTVQGTVGEVSSDTDRIYGGIANVNAGSITHSKVTVTEDGKIVGYTVGGIAGRNDGTIEDCIVLVNGNITASGEAGRNLYVGGVAGVNYGTIEGTSEFSKWSNEDVNVRINGTLSAVSKGVGETVNVGGAVGYNASGKVVRLIVEVYGVIRAGAPEGESKDNVRAGGFVGHSRAAVNHDVVIMRGEVYGGLVGGTAGYLDGVTVSNTWQVTYTDTMDATGKGARQINRLCVKGNGVIAVSIAFDSNSILFTDVTPEEGADIDGWYESGMVVGSKIGNVDEGTFRPNTTIQNKYVEVVFVNTIIRTVRDLVDMASSVSGGLSGTNIEFTIPENTTLTINADDTIVSIGTERRPFNNVFNGNNCTIVFNALGGTDYVGLFGYIGSQGIVKNVKLVLNEGTYGSADALYTALLAAYSDGRIENVEITVHAGATLIGQNVGALAGASFGNVENVTVTLDGAVSAVSEKDAYAAAVIAKNDERMTKVTVTATGAISAVGQSYSYAGILAAKTTSTITDASVTTSATVSAGAGNAYAGFGVGINLGKLENTYINVIGGGFAGNGTNGGIVGNNANALSCVLIKLPTGGLGAGNDSAIGSIGGAGEAIDNVWVYASEISSMSKVPAVNCIAAAGGMTLSCPTAEEVRAGTIAYYGDVSLLTDRFALFAAVTNGSCEVGTGAVTENVTYKTVSFATEQKTYLAFTSAANVTGVKAFFTARASIGSGTELAAFALAVNSGKYTLAGTFTLANDITLPAGRFEAIGTMENYLDADIIFDGQDHIITVGDAIITDGVFGVSNAKIRNVGLRLTASGDGTLVAESHGTVDNVALYVEKGVTVTADKVIVSDEHGITTNAWVITRNEGTNAASYPVMKVNGAGNVTMKEGELFAEKTGDDTIFIGYADSVRILVKEATFPTAGRKQGYTAEFISTVISDENALRVLDGVMKLEYTGANRTFTFSENVTVTATLEGMNAYAFKGIIDGAGKTVVVGNAVTGTLFGKMQGTLKNIRIDLSAVSSDLTLFASDANPSLQKVVIVEDRDDWALGTTQITAEYTYFETSNDTFYDRFQAAPYQACSVIMNYGKARIAYTFGDRISATEQEDASQKFAGWKKDGAILSDKTIELATQAGSRYVLNYINRTLGDAGDLIRLAEAVQGGFDYEGVTFTVENGFNVHVSVPTIGSAEHPFKGSIRGNTKYSKITFEGDTSAFLYALHGTLENVTFAFKGGATADDGAKPSLVYNNYGTMSSVVVVAGDAFAEGAALTYNNMGMMTNCWFVTSGEDEIIAEGGRVGANRVEMDEDLLYIIDVQFEVSKVGVRIRLTFPVLSGNYLALYNESGKVTFFDNYSHADHSYIATSNASGMHIEARSLDKVSNEDEFKYLRQFLVNRHLANNSVITLANDLTVTSAVSMPLGYAVDDTDYDFTFDLGYHTLTVSSTEVGSVFTSENGKGTIRNGTVCLSGTSYALASAGMELQNVALHLPIAGITVPIYAVTDCAIVTPYKEYYNAAYECYYYQAGADVVINVASAGITVQGKDNDKYYYATNLDYYSLNEYDEKTLYGLTKAEETMLIYAPAVISNANDVRRFIFANEVSLEKFEGRTFRFATDVTIDGIERPLTGFRGTLDAGYTLIVAPDLETPYDAAVFAAAEGGSFRNFALAFGKNCTLAAANMIVGTAENCVVISYRDLATYHTEDGAIALNVDKNGLVSITFENDGITFTGVDVGNSTVGYYALYSWKKVVGAAEEVVSTENAYSVSGDSAVRVFVATFDRRYAFTLNYKDKDGFHTIDDTVLAENAGDLPSFKITGAKNDKVIIFTDGQAVCFEKDFSASMKIEVTNIGTGFMFWGMQATSVVEKTDAWHYDLSAPTAENLSATIDVFLTHIKMDWKKMEYNAGSQAVAKTAVISAIEGGLAAGQTATYNYDNLGDTPPCVTIGLVNVPYHVGKYRVNFVVKQDGYVICNAYAGLEITPVELRFISVKIADKVYDGTPDASLISVELDGYLTPADKSAVSAVGLAFCFADANAGVNKQIKVSGKGELRCSQSKVNDHTYKYTYLDYTFDFDAPIRSSNEGLITATIKKKDLTLSISSIKVDYLQQFGKESTAFLPSNTSTVEDAVNAGLIAEDYAMFTSVVSGLLTREDPDRYEVDAYRIIVDQTGAFDRLSNYNVTVLGDESTDPYYIVAPSEIEVEFLPCSVVYGARPAIGGYTVTYKGNAVDISALQLLDESGAVIKTVKDTLVFENVVFAGGAELIPSETKYGVRCLFSSANKNYTLKADGNEAYETVNGETLRVIDQADVLTVTPKTVRIVSDDERNTKLFGKRKETLYASVMTGYKPVGATHKLVVTREAGETVGSYVLHYSIMDTADPAAPVDVTDRYRIVEDESSTHCFTITKVAVKIRISETTLMYGESIGDKLKYTVVIGDGSLTVRDLYYALKGEEKANATLADIGIDVKYNQNTVLNVGDNYTSADVGFGVENRQTANIEEDISIVEKGGCIHVQKRYLTIVLSSGDSKSESMTKKYDGTYDLPSDPEYTVGIVTKDNKGKVISVQNGLVEKDQALVDVVMTRAYVVGSTDDPRGLTVGAYRVNADFAMYQKGSTRLSDLASNYEIRVMQLTLEVKQADVRIEAKLGSFDEEGAYVQSKVVHLLPDGTEMEQTDQMFYGDVRQQLCFSIPEKYKNSYSFLKVPAGTEKEISDYIEKELKITYNKLCKVNYGTYTEKSVELSLSGANNNYNIVFTAEVNIARVNIKVTLLPTTKVFGDADPTIDYILTAYDDNGGEEIEGYFEYARDAYNVTILADRTQGESLGTYEYSNIVVAVSNAYSGETLTENVETDEEQAVLIIERESFLKSTIGKILVYGGPVLIVLGLAIFLIIYVTVLREKWKAAKKQKDEELFSDDEDEEGDGAEGSDAEADAAENDGAEGNESGEGNENGEAGEGADEAPKAAEGEPVSDEAPVAPEEDALSVGDEAAPSMPDEAPKQEEDVPSEDEITLEVSDSPIDEE